MDRVRYSFFARFVVVLAKSQSLRRNLCCEWALWVRTGEKHKTPKRTSCHGSCYHFAIVTLWTSPDSSYVQSHEDKRCHCFRTSPSPPFFATRVRMLSMSRRTFSARWRVNCSRLGLLKKSGSPLESLITDLMTFGQVRK